MQSNRRVPLRPLDQNIPANSTSSQKQINTQYSGLIYSQAYFNPSNYQIQMPGQTMPLSYSTPSSIHQRPNQANEQDINRKIKKKYLERRRRAKINDRTKAMYDLVYKMSGEDHPRKTEICEMLGDCLKVMQSFYTALEKNQGLRSIILPPGILSWNSRRQSIQQVHHKASEGKENTLPNSVPSPSSFLPKTAPLSRNINSVFKRESFDSGFGKSHSNIQGSSSMVFEPQPSKRSRSQAESKLWRPYLL